MSTQITSSAGTVRAGTEDNEFPEIEDLYYIDIHSRSPQVKGYLANLIADALDEVEDDEVLTLFKQDRANGDLSDDDYVDFSEDKDVEAL